MAAFRLSPFLGTAPKLSSRLLPEGMGQIANNIKLPSGELRPLFEPSSVAVPNVVGPHLAIYRLSSGTSRAWLAWSRDVDAVRSPVPTSDGRTIYTGDGEPRVTNYSLATSGGGGDYPKLKYVLGVTPPTTAPTVGVSGTAGTTPVSRAFAYTFVATWPDGTTEESALSPASAAVSGYGNGAGQWDISGLQTAPPNAGTISAAVSSGGLTTVTLNSVFGLRAGEEITFAGVAGMTSLNGTFAIVSVDAALGKVVVALTTAQTYSAAADTWTRVAPHNTGAMVKRLYWTESGAYILCKDNIAVASTTATVLYAVIATGLAISMDHDMPPAGMTGIISLPGALLAGFNGKELCFSKPGYPYAWPEDTRLTVDFPIVGIAGFGSSIAIATTGTPYVAMGGAPEAMGLIKADTAYPCLSKRSIVSLSSGAVWATPMGLAYVSDGAPQLWSQKFFTRDEWAPLNPESMVATAADRTLFVMYDTGTGGTGTLMFDLDDGGLTTAGVFGTDVWTDPEEDQPYFAVGGAILAWDAGDYRLPGTWKSRDVVLRQKINLTAARVDFTSVIPAATAAALLAARNAAIASNAAVVAAGDAGSDFGDDYFGETHFGASDFVDVPVVAADAVAFTLFVDGQIKHQCAVSDSKPFRLPGGYKSDNFAVQVTGNVPILNIQLAETVQGLRDA